MPFIKTKTDKERFIEKIHTDSSGCWLWTGCRSKAKYTQGYGKFSCGTKRNGSRKIWEAHRFSYFIFNGEIPAGFEIDHLCRNRSCVNPMHLEAVTHAENVRRSPIAGGKYNSIRTHCYSGHEYTTANTAIVIRGGKNHRRCRQCAREKAFYKRRKLNIPQRKKEPSARL